MATYNHKIWNAMNKYYEVSNRTVKSQLWPWSTKQKRIKENRKYEKAQCRKTASKLPQSLHKIGKHNSMVQNNQHLINQKRDLIGLPEYKSNEEPLKVATYRSTNFVTQWTNTTRWVFEHRQIKVIILKYKAKKNQKKIASTNKRKVGILQ